MEARCVMFRAFGIKIDAGKCSSFKGEARFLNPDGLLKTGRPVPEPG